MRARLFSVLSWGLGLALLPWATSAFAQTPLGFSSGGDASAEQIGEALIGLKKGAMDLVSQAYHSPRTQGEWKDILAKTYQAITNASLIKLASTDPEASQCKTVGAASVVAFVLPGKNAIHLCPAFFRDTWIAKIQTLVHESAHVAGYLDECQATAVQENVSRVTGVGSSGGDAYVTVFEMCDAQTLQRTRSDGDGKRKLQENMKARGF